MKIEIENTEFEVNINEVHRKTATIAAAVSLMIDELIHLQQSGEIDKALQFHAAAKRQIDEIKDALEKFDLLEDILFDI